MKIIDKRYVTLKDRRNRPRVILCIMETDEIVYDWTDLVEPGIAIGIAIRSDDDKNDIEVGRQLARNRAIRAAKGRRNCYVVRPEAIANIWSLKKDDFLRFMHVTNGMVQDFPKQIAEQGYKMENFWRWIDGKNTMA